MAPGADVPDLIEVELTAKSVSRYGVIRSQLVRRLESGTVGRVVYLCEPRAAAAVREHLMGGLVPTLKARFEVIEAFDRMGAWTTEWTPTTVRDEVAAAVTLDVADVETELPAGWLR